MGFKKITPYECYKDLDFKIPVGNGDCYDRYFRVEEMRRAKDYNSMYENYQKGQLNQSTERFQKR